MRRPWSPQAGCSSWSTGFLSVGRLHRWVADQFINKTRRGSSCVGEQSQVQLHLRQLNLGSKRQHCFHKFFLFFRLQSHLGQRSLLLTHSPHPSTLQVQWLCLPNVPYTFPLLSVPLSLPKCRFTVGHVGQEFEIWSETAVFTSQFMQVAVWSQANYWAFQNFCLQFR